ncbi:hypothetical protein G153_12632 [Megasphaera sp. BL7]|nr:hypothetical protein G153_12632 [Megasphaera sp. BL7]
MTGGGVSSQTKIGRIYHRDESLIRRTAKRGLAKLRVRLAELRD